MPSPAARSRTPLACATLAAVGSSTTPRRATTIPSAGDVPQTKPISGRRRAAEQQCCNRTAEQRRLTQVSTRLGSARISCTRDRPSMLTSDSMRTSDNQMHHIIHLVFVSRDRMRGGTGGREAEMGERG
jgi:hypothetical protein